MEHTILTDKQVGAKNPYLDDSAIILKGLAVIQRELYQHLLLQEHPDEQRLDGLDMLSLAGLSVKVLDRLAGDACGQIETLVRSGNTADSDNMK